MNLPSAAIHPRKPGADLLNATFPPMISQSSSDIRQDRLQCLSRQHKLTTKLRALSPFQLGLATTSVRKILQSLDFHEVVLNPFDAHSIDYRNSTIDVPGFGQLRFNTEPEIWEASKDAERFFSITPLFRKEPDVSLLRRPGFWIVDFYQVAPPEALLDIFVSILQELADAGLADHLIRLPMRKGVYNGATDGPAPAKGDLQWIITDGYDASSSFFEVDNAGISTRREVFLVTPLGNLEVGVLGITGWNKNPDYRMRSQSSCVIQPNLNRSGMCIGLERLLLANQLVASLNAS